MMNLEAEAIRLIQQKMEEKGWSKALLARKTGLQASTVSRMMQSERITMNRIVRLSELMDYNFLWVLDNQLNMTNPPRPKYAEEHDEATYRKRIRELEIENATLLKILNKQNRL